MPTELGLCILIPMLELDLETPASDRPFRYYFKKYRRLFSLGIAALFFTNLLDVVAPLLLKQALDQIQAQVPFSDLLRTCLIFTGTLAAVALFRYLWRIFFGRFHHGVADDLRNVIFHKLTRLGSSFFQKSPTGELMSLVTNDVNAFRMGIGPGTLILFDGAFLTIFILPVMFWLNWEWTLKTLVLLPFTPFVIQKIEHLIHETFKVRQDKFADLSGMTQEVASGIKVIKSYAQEDHQTSFYDVKSKALEKASNRVALVDSMFHPILEFAVACGVAILLVVSSDDVISGAASLGTLVAFQQYIQRMIWPMAALGAGVTFVQQAKASYQRINKLIQEPLDLPEGGEHSLGPVKSIEFRDLTFTYPGEAVPALKDVSLTIREGETLGIVGPVGAGKSTLVQALCHLWPVPPQSIFLNGLPLEEYQRSTLGQRISLIPQEAFLFTDTLVDNVSFGLKSRASESALRRVLDQVNLLDEASSMVHGAESVIGERGVNLSGGQKQRLALARALIRQSDVTIFDDSLSAVDGRTESRILENLNERESGQISIIISHRLATLKHADKILVLKDGQVEAVGTATELMETSSTFQNIARLQGAFRELQA